VQGKESRAGGARTPLRGDREGNREKGLFGKPACLRIPPRGGRNTIKILHKGANSKKAVNSKGGKSGGASIDGKGSGKKAPPDPQPEQVERKGDLMKG